MRPIRAALLVLVLLGGACAPDQKPELKDQKSRESYSLGYQYGQSFKRDGVEIDLKVFTGAMREGLEGRDPRMTPQDMRAAVKDLRQRVIATKHRQAQEEMDRNLEEAKAFLAKNAKEEGVKTLPSGLQYRVLREGSGRSPKATDTVAVRYRGTLRDGTEFESTKPGDEPATFRVDGVIPGWTEALQLMKEGARWQLFVPPELGYRRRGLPNIPPNSALVFEIELVAVK